MRAEGKHGLGVCWAGTQTMPAQEPIHNGLAPHVWEELWDWEQKGSRVTWSWASHFLPRPHVTSLQKQVHATCSYVSGG